MYASGGFRIKKSSVTVQGWKLAPARLPMTGKCFIGPVEIVSGLSKISYYFNTVYGIWKQIVGFGSCRAGRQKS